MRCPTDLSQAQLFDESEQRLSRWLFRGLLIAESVLVAACGCGPSINMAPVELDGRCTVHVQGDYSADVLLQGEERAFFVFDSDDTGQRYPVRLGGVRSLVPAQVEVKAWEQPGPSPYARVVLLGREEGPAVIQIDVVDSYSASTFQKVMVAASEKDLHFVDAGCP
jgi:hypothetical protein